MMTAEAETVAGMTGGYPWNGAQTGRGSWTFPTGVADLIGELVLIVAPDEIGA